MVEFSESPSSAHSHCMVEALIENTELGGLPRFGKRTGITLLCPLLCFTIMPWCYRCLRAITGACLLKVNKTFVKFFSLLLRELEITELIAELHLCAGCSIEPQRILTAVPREVRKALL